MSGDKHWMRQVKNKKAKEKLIEKMTGENNPVHRTDVKEKRAAYNALPETKEKQSQRMLALGENHPMKQLKNRLKMIGINNINYGKKATKIIEVMGKKIIGINLKDGSKKFYPSIGSTRVDGFIPSLICYCLNGKRKTHKGYIWSLFKEGDI